MPTIGSGDAAIETADRLVQKYHPFRVLKRAQKEDGVWVVEFDVGVIKTQIVRVTLDVKTGKVLEYKGAETA